MWSSVMSDPLDELAADPDVISGGGEDFSAFVMSPWWARSTPSSGEAGVSGCGAQVWQRVA
jgi:hypothetical protein